MRSVGTFYIFPSLSLVFHSIRDPTPDHVSLGIGSLGWLLAGGESDIDQVGRLGSVCQKGAAKPVQKLTPEPADTIP